MRTSQALLCARSAASPPEPLFLLITLSPLMLHEKVFRIFQQAFLIGKGQAVIDVQKAFCAHRLFIKHWKFSLQEVIASYAKYAANANGQMPVELALAGFKFSVKGIG